MAQWPVGRWCGERLTEELRAPVAVSLSISYSATDTDCFTGSNTMIPDIPGSETMYRLPGLEEGTEYSITVTATLTEGGSEQDVDVGTTWAAGESNSHIAI